MSKEKLALNLSPYKKMSRNEALTSLSDDIASLALEASGKINPYTLIVAKEGMAINPQRPSTDIKDQLSEDTDIEKVEKEVALKRRDYLLNLEGNYVVVWLSPSNPYPRGSLDVGISRQIQGKKALESYGIGVSFSKEQYIALGKNLSSLSEEKEEVEDIKDLRKTAFLIKLQEQDNPYDLLEEIIPLKGVWEKIKSKKALEKKRQALMKARKMATKRLEKIKGAKTRTDILRVGAGLEREMARTWTMMDIAAKGCGTTNARALNEIAYSFTHSQIDKNGNVTQRHSEVGQYVQKCPYCGAVIGKVIKPGYRCSCGNIYKGVC